jgi:hypothetical protein
METKDKSKPRLTRSFSFKKINRNPVLKPKTPLSSQGRAVQLSLNLTEVSRGVTTEVAVGGVEKQDLVNRL